MYFLDPLPLLLPLRLLHVALLSHLPLSRLHKGYLLGVNLRGYATGEGAGSL